MTGKYRQEPKAVDEWMRWFDGRLKALETAKRAGLTAVDTGSLVIGGNGGFTVMTSGEGIPDHLTNYYSFFGWTVVNGVIQKRDDNNYTFAILIILPDSPNPVNAYGAVRNGDVKEAFLITCSNEGTPLFWVGATQSADIRFGSFFGEVSVLHSNSKTYLSDTLLPVRNVTNVQEAVCNAQLTLSTSQQNVSGCLITATTVKANAIAEVTGTFDFQETVAGTTVCQGGLVVDGGAAEAKLALLGVAATTDRGTVSQTWQILLATAGVHTLQLVALRTAAAGTQVANATHTNITAKVLEL